MAVFNNILAGASGQAGGAAGYEIERSLRFNSADSAYLSRPNSTAGEQRVMTFSWWMKANDTSSSADQIIFGQDYATSGDHVTARSLNIVYYQGQVGIYDYGASDAAGNTGNSVPWTPGYIDSSAVFRDPSAWYHFVIAVDTTQSVAADRVKVYVNGVQRTHSSYPVQNSYLSWGQARNDYIGGHFVNGGYTRSLNAQLADVQFVSGLQLPAYYFGEYDANNVWQPKAFDDGGATVNDGTTFSSISGALGSAAYDGNTSTSFNAVSGTYYKISSGFTVANSLRVFARQDEQWQYRSTEQNQINLVRAASGPVYGWIDVPVTGTQTNPEIRVTSGGSPIYAIEVDGVIMIDSTTTTLAYGSRGFNLLFDDASSASALGTDSTSNGNNWTVNNISVTAGAGNDSLFDSPTNGTPSVDTGLGGELSGNYCTMSPIDSKNFTLSNGNLDVTVGSNSCGRGTFFAESGKWYFEFDITSVGNPYVGIGSNGVLTNYSSENSVVVPNTGLVTFRTNGSQVQPGYTVSMNSVATYSVAMDLDNNKIWWGKAGQWYKYDTTANQTSSKANIEAGIDHFDFSSNTSKGWTVQFGTSSNATGYVLNAGQRPFAYPSMVPSGYKSLCTANLPTPDIADGSTAMDVVTYDGQSGNKSISSLSFQPEFLWVKSRNLGSSHHVYDVMRGGNRLATDAPNGDYNNGDFVSFDTNGFTLGNSSQVNSAGNTYVAWTWDGGTAFSNSAGTNGATIASSGYANTSAGFSVFTYTGNSTSGATVAHGLGVKPAFFVVKNRDSAESWCVYHESQGATKYAFLNVTNAFSASSALWNDTEPTSSVITLGNYNGTNNGDNFVAYCFAPVEGYSAFGQFTGNGLPDGPFVYTGMRPRFIFYKCASVNGDWWNFIDTARATYNPVGPYLESGPQGESSASVFDVLSNGFKPRFGLGNQWNGSGQTYVYMAWAESPFKYARAR